MNIEKVNIAIIGQGYVGLPLAIEYGKKYPTIGFDINTNRINDLKNHIDYTNEATSNQLKSAKKLNFSSDINDITNCNVFIVTVPTPIDEYKTPDLKPLKGASKMLGKILKKGDVFHFPPGIPHQEEALTKCIIIEASTPHFNDRVRVEKKYGIISKGGLPTTSLQDIRFK